MLYLNPLVAAELATEVYAVNQNNKKSLDDFLMNPIFSSKKPKYYPPKLVLDYSIQPTDLAYAPWVQEILLTILFSCSTTVNSLAEGI
jgi:hypothetical protein